uniref:Zinc finger RING-type eukaryotic domain-containing protein n=1 Tax=Scophthalmus maximus TaxID=52904 RepID=A0A8D3CI64_SCOMX
LDLQVEDGWNQHVRESLSCSICLDLLTDPVTIPCGHSYCMKPSSPVWFVWSLIVRNTSNITMMFLR